MRKRHLGLLVILTLLLLQILPVFGFAADGADIIIDNNDPGCSVQGEWTKGTYNSDFYGSNYLSDNTAGADEDKSVTFTPVIAAEALYRIYLWWPAGTNRPTEVPIEIQHRDGVDAGITVNMRANGGQWNLLGTYTLSKGESNYVKILATAAGYTMADAVRFEEVVPDPLEGLQKPVQFADTAGTRYQNAADFLGTIGVINGYEDGNFRPEEPVTRAEMTAIAARILGVSGGGAADGESYADVAPDHWAAADIAAATALGIVNGDGGQFRPEDPVLYEEAAKMLVCALGYDVYAENEGGYPLGYWKVAARYDLLAGVTAERTAQAVRGDVAAMVYQTLRTEILEPVAFGSTTRYESRKDVTLLSENLGIYRGEGVVEETDQTALLAGESSLKQGEVRIGGQIYLYGYTDIAARLGQSVEFYYTESPMDRERFVVLCYTLRDRFAKEELTLQANRIQSVKAEYGAIRMTYEAENGRYKEAEISSAANVIWNGKRLDTYTEADLKPASGAVTLVRDSGSGGYDTVRVTSYETVVADGVFAASGVVKNKIGDDFRYDPNDADVVCAILKDGVEIELGDIQEWNVLSVQQSRDGKLIQVLVSDHPVFGMLNRLDQSAEPATAVVDERSMELVPGLELDMKLGTENTFYLDAFGRIAAAGEQSLGGVGILKGAAKLSGIAQTALFKVLNQDNEWQVLYGADRIIYNGVRQDGAKVADTLAGLIGKDEVKYSQIIRYRLNDADKIVSIDTPVLEEAGEDQKQALLTTGTLRNLTYRSATKSLQHTSDVTQKVYLDEETVIVKAPKSNVEEEKEYQFETAAVFTDNRNYEVITFNESEFAIPDIILICQDDYSGASVYSSSKVMLVSYVSQGIDAEGNTNRTVHGYFDGQEVDLPIAESVTQDIFPDPGQGDLIRFNRNRDGEISGVVQTLDFDAIHTDAMQTVTLTNNYLQTVLGKVLDVKNGKIRVETNSADLTEKIQSVWDAANNAVNVYLYDENRQADSRCSSGSLGDIVEGDLVFIQYSKFKATSLVIYKLN